MRRARPRMAQHFKKNSWCCMLCSLQSRALRSPIKQFHRDGEFWLRYACHHQNNPFIVVCDDALPLFCAANDTGTTASSCALVTVVVDVVVVVVATLSFHRSEQYIKCVCTLCMAVCVHVGTQQFCVSTS